jgi:glycosyltransferase involved in cell wall biosynthesis
MLIPTFLPQIIGGAQSQVMRLSVALKNNHDVEPWIMTQRLNGSAKREILKGILIQRISSWFYPLGFLFGLPRLLDHNLKLIHVHTVDSPVLLALLAKLFAYKRVVVKAPSPKQLERFFSRPRGRYLAKHIDAFVALTPEMEKVLLKLEVPEYKIWQIPNGIDTDEYSFVSTGMRLHLRKRLGFHRDTFICSFVGRLIDEKNIPFLLQAWASVVTQIHNSCLLIIGNGAQKETLQVLSRSLGINNSVKFLGEINQSQVRDYVSTSDCFILPSKGEGMSNALLEAMALGTAAIVSENAASKAIIEHCRTGLRIKTESDLQKAILELYENKELMDGIRQAARKKVLDQFSIKHTSDRHMQMYQELTGKIQ